MKQPQILVVGSMVMDLIVGMERFPEQGETVFGNFFRTAPGGKGANQAVQAARLGAAVTMLGKVGNDDFAVSILNTMKESGVNTDGILVSEKEPTAVGNVQIQSHGGKTDNRICVVPGANMDIDVSEIEFLQEEIAAFDMVILQLEIPMEVNAAVAKFAAAKGVPVMLNTAPFAPLPDELWQYLTFVSPNEHEALSLTGVEVTDIDSARRAADIMSAKGVKNVIITMGSRGAYLRTEEGDGFYPAVPNVKSVDPTAAGDSFVAAFCTALCRGMSAPEAMAFANRTAAVTVSRMGAMPSLPTLKEVIGE